MDRADAIKILVRSRPAFDIGKNTVFTDAYDTAIAALREQEQSKWISVKERLPEESGPVLAYETSLGVIAAYYHADMISSAWQSITHWMPLPEPPKEGAEG